MSRGRSTFGGRISAGAREAAVRGVPGQRAGAAGGDGEPGGQPRDRLRGARTSSTRSWRYPAAHGRRTTSPDAAEALTRTSLHGGSGKQAPGHHPVAPSVARGAGRGNRAGTPSGDSSSGQENPHLPALGRPPDRSAGALEHVFRTGTSAHPRRAPCDAARAPARRPLRGARGSSPPTPRHRRGRRRTSLPPLQPLLWFAAGTPRTRPASSRTPRWCGASAAASIWLAPILQGDALRGGPRPPRRSGSGDQEPLRAGRKAHRVSRGRRRPWPGRPGWRASSSSGSLRWPTSPSPDPRHRPLLWRGVERPRGDHSPRTSCSPAGAFNHARWCAPQRTDGGDQTLYRALGGGLAWCRARDSPPPGSETHPQQPKAPPPTADLDSQRPGRQTGWPEAKVVREKLTGFP